MAHPGVTTDSLVAASSELFLQYITSKTNLNHLSLYYLLPPNVALSSFAVAKMLRTIFGYIILKKAKNISTKYLMPISKHYMYE